MGPACLKGLLDMRFVGQRGSNEGPVIRLGPQHGAIAVQEENQLREALLVQENITEELLFGFEIAIFQIKRVRGSHLLQLDLPLFEIAVDMLAYHLGDRQSLLEGGFDALTQCFHAQEAEEGQQGKEAHYDQQADSRSQADSGKKGHGLFPDLTQLRLDSCSVFRYDSTRKGCTRVMHTPFDRRRSPDRARFASVRRPSPIKDLGDLRPSELDTLSPFTHE